MYLQCFYSALCFYAYTTTKMPCFALASHLKDIGFKFPRQLLSWTKNKKQNGLNNKKKLTNTLFQFEG